MRWFKHISRASDNPVLAKIEDRFGLPGCARFWKLVEAIASQMEPGRGPVLGLPWQKWQTILKAKRKQLRLFLGFLRNEGQINLNETENILEITFPNIQKYRDEYSQKAGRAPEVLRSKIERESAEQERESVLSFEKKEPKKAVSFADEASADPYSEWVDGKLIAKAIDPECFYVSFDSSERIQKAGLGNAEFGLLLPAMALAHLMGGSTTAAEVVKSWPRETPDYILAKLRALESTGFLHLSPSDSDAVTVTLSDDLTPVPPFEVVPLYRLN